jgi:hypothetical protein
MKALCSSLMVAGLIVLTGCNPTNTGGGPTSSGGPGTFKLKGPLNTPATEVKQGETKPVDITIDPDKSFKEDVELSASVDPADRGVTAEISPTHHKAGDYKKVELKIKASEKAAEGKYNITVTGKPTKGDPAKTVVEVKVPAPKK